MLELARSKYGHFLVRKLINTAAKEDIPSEAAPGQPALRDAGAPSTPQPPQSAVPEQAAST
jgi:hypothetical protein